MRQIKALLKAKKPMWRCGECKCLLLQARRCADEYCNCGDPTTEDMVEYGLNRFKSTPVFQDLNSSEQEEALANAQTILEGAGEGIAPFYNAVKQGKTFAYYVNLMGLTVDESGPCDSSVYEDEEAFIIYISAMGAIHCKYLALVARRGLTPTKELANKDAISNYLDWVTTDTVTYQFKDWDDEILTFGSVKKGETPEAPEDPTREGYTFTGWSPAIGAIDIDTTYVAQYTPIINQYTVTIQSNNVNYGTVDETSVTVNEGTAISTSGNKLTIGDTVVTATAETGYEFSSWGTLPATVTETLTITATFQAEGYTITFAAWDDTNNQEGGGTVSPTTAQAPIGALLFVNASDTADAQIRIGEPGEAPDAQLLMSIEGTEDEGYINDGWYVYNESTQEWDYHYAAFIPITGNMQVRNYFRQNQEG